MGCTAWNVLADCTTPTCFGSACYPIHLCCTLCSENDKRLWLNGERDDLGSRESSGLDEEFLKPGMNLTRNSGVECWKS